MTKTSYIEKTITILEEYGFKTEDKDSFKEKIQNIDLNYYPSEKAVQKIAKMCMRWKRFFPEEDFSRLAYDSLIELLLIGVTGTSHDPELRAYVGKNYNLDMERMPKFLYIIIKASGDAFIQTEFAGIRKKF